jgi:hypothetical protein
MLLLSLERMLCLDALLFMGLLTELDSTLLMFLVLTVSLLFLLPPGGLGGTTDWLLAWIYLAFGGSCFTGGLIDVSFCEASIVLGN